VKRQPIPEIGQWLLSVGAPALLCLVGWGQVITQNQQLQTKTIRSYQQTQLHSLKILSHVMGHQIGNQRLQAKTAQTPLNPQQQIVQPMLDQLAQLHPTVRFYAFPISGPSTNLPTDLHDIPIGELRTKALQDTAPRPSGPPALPPGNVAVLPMDQGSTAISEQWYANTPATINTWTAITVSPHTPQQETWIFGSANPPSAIMQHSGSDRQIQRSTLNMAILTIVMIALAALMVRMQRHYAKAVVTQLMDTDPLTGLANRRKLQQAGNLALHQVHQEQPLALVILNLDRFRPINDLLGPDAGDELLIKVAERLQGVLRKEDLLARLSGDEFAVLLHNTNDYHAQICAERLLRELDQPFWINGRANHISGSIGIATTHDSGISFSQFLSQSDAAMSRTKSQQQGGYTLFNPSMYSETLDQLSLESDLRRAIERHELRVYYQPIVDLKTRQTKGYEALVRWQHRQRGLLHPGVFLPIAAAIGWTISMERWVLRQACAQMAAWYGSNQRSAEPLSRSDSALESVSDSASDSPEFPTISVNISAQHLTQACLPHYDLVGYIQQVLQETGWPAHGLILEITEDALINSAEAVAACLSEIQAIGVRISLDDFGTGYSSLSYLQHFPVDILKIDKSFIRLIHDRMQDGEIVKTIISLANSLGVSTIAEGIETEEQLDHLQSLHCQYGQGFLFSRPLKHLGPDRRTPAIPPTSIMTSLMPEGMSAQSRAAS
jgi:diguanylate cyclase (GGDEF)-like protein